MDEVTKNVIGNGIPKNQVLGAPRQKRGPYKTKAQKKATAEARKALDNSKLSPSQRKRLEEGQAEALRLKEIMGNEDVYRRAASLMASGKYSDHMIASVLKLNFSHITKMRNEPVFNEILELYRGVGDSLRHDLELLSIELSSLALNAYHEELTRKPEDADYDPDRRLKAAKEILAVSGSDISTRPQKQTPTNQTNIQINVEEAQRAIDVMSELYPNRVIVHRDAKEISYEPATP